MSASGQHAYNPSDLQHRNHEAPKIAVVAHGIAQEEEQIDRCEEVVAQQDDEPLDVEDTSETGVEHDAHR